MTARQIPLWTAPHARRSDPWTSKAAAMSVSDLSETQGRLLWTYKVCGPMTDHEMLARARQAGIRASDSGLRTRRRELVDMGELEDTGETRPSPSGRASIVWGVATGEDL